MEKAENFGDKTWNAVGKMISGLSMFLMAQMCVMVVLSVFLRYIFNIAYTWSEELIILLFIATTYFGSIMCVKEKEHIDIPFFREKASDKVGFIMDIFVCVVNITIQITLAYISFSWISKTGSSITVGLKIPYYYIYSLFPISFTTMAIYTLRRLVDIITARKETEKKGDK